MKKQYIQPEFLVEDLDIETLMEGGTSNAPTTDKEFDNGNGANNFSKKNNLGFSFYEDDEDEDV